MRFSAPLIAAALIVGLATLTGCAPVSTSAPTQALVGPTPTLTPPATAPAESIGDGVLRDIDYAGHGNQAQTLDLYLPTSADRPGLAPIVVFVHGGGWSQGSKAMLENRAGGVAAFSDLLRAHGYAVAGVNYRLSGEATWPAPMHDLKAAVRHLRANAAEYGLDPGRVVIAGESAGGHLAMMLGLTPGNAELNGPDGPRDERTDVSAIISFYGVSDLRTLPADRHENDCPPQSMPGGPTLEGAMLGVEPSADEGALLGAMASPIMYASAAAPPLLLLHGTIDCTVPDVQSTRMHKAMTESGGRVELKLTQADHASPVFYADSRLQAEVLAFLEASIAP